MDGASLKDLAREQRVSKMAKELDDARWFESIGKCRCGKPANGWVNGRHNQKMETCCQKCGEARVKRATDARDKAEAKELAADIALAGHRE